MPILIHLNGPSGVGNSTLAQRYVDEHPGVLNLDIDALVSSSAAGETTSSSCSHRLVTSLSPWLMLTCATDAMW